MPQPTLLECPRPKLSNPIGCLALLAASTVLTPFVAGQTLNRETQPADSKRGGASEALCGKLSDFKGLPVLELWGTPHQAGYAHGYLLAEQIRTVFDEYILDPQIIPNPGIYEMFLRPAVRRQFVWSDAAMAELSGLLKGVQDRLGAERCRSEKLGRSLEIDDLLVANSIADWYGLFCSSVSVWGRYTKDGQVITARHLDYPATTAMVTAQLIMVRRHEGDRRSWLAVGWPGALGVYTAMNDQGVTMLLHDATGLPASQADGFTPRSLILREALESARADNYVLDIAGVLKKHRVMVGNSVHVSTPLAKGRPPAVIFEYDGNRDGAGLTIRTPTDERLTPCPDALWCTNHMRLRRPPAESGRFTALSEELARLAAAGRELDSRAAFELIDVARQDTTLHTVVLIPHEQRMHILIPALQEGPVELHLPAWLSTPEQVKSTQAPAMRKSHSKKPG